MRVIAGEYKGRSLVAPKGMNTRPTTDRVRESLFSTLVSARGGFEGAVVLDAFAGSGALGIEALSRGARFALFCERDRAALASLSRNTQFLTSGSFRVVHTDVCKRPPAVEDPFDVLFFDPPYAYPASMVWQILETLEAGGKLAPAATIVYENNCSDHADLLLSSPNGLELEYFTRKTFGLSCIDIYRKV